MRGNSGPDRFRFQRQAVSNAVDVLEEYRMGGIDEEEIGRQGVKIILREETTPAEKAAVLAQYQRSEIDEDVARVFLGDRLDAMLGDAEETREVMEEDETSDLVQ